MHDRPGDSPEARVSRAAEARASAIFAAVSEGLLLLDDGCVVVDANAAAAGMIAAAPDDLRGRPLGGIAANWTAADFAALRASGRWQGELALGADGGRTSAATTIVAVDPSGDAGWLAVLRDLRERREDERLQQEFASGIAHDLKNPLTAVRGQAQLMRRRIERGAPQDPERLLAGLAAIEDAAVRMTGMIDELSDAARLRAGQPLVLQRQSCDLAAIARRNVEEMQRYEDHHRVALVLDEPSIVGMWDAARLDRVVENLLSNAVKFSPDGGPVAVRVSREGDGDEAVAVLTVSDHGVGIPAVDLPHVFERFHRGRNVGGIRGSGIGLAGASAIVAAHGGVINAESREGKGSVFTVRLPVRGA